MFPDLARDDVFRLETARLMAALAARVRRSGDPSVLLPVGGRALHRPHPPPYPPGSAERFIYAAREANASGRDLTLVMTPRRASSTPSARSASNCAAPTG